MIEFFLFQNTHMHTHTHQRHVAFSYEYALDIFLDFGLLADDELVREQKLILTKKNFKK